MEMEVFKDLSPSHREGIDCHSDLFCGFVDLFGEGFDELFVEVGNGAVSLHFEGVVFISQVLKLAELFFEVFWKTVLLDVAFDGVAATVDEKLFWIAEEETSVVA